MNHTAGFSTGTPSTLEIQQPRMMIQRASSALTVLNSLGLRTVPVESSEVPSWMLALDAGRCGASAGSVLIRTACRANVDKVRNLG